MHLRHLIKFFLIAVQINREHMSTQRRFILSWLYHSIFRLALIIVNEWFPYYEMWHDDKPAPNNRKYDALRRGYLTWSTNGAVRYINKRGNWHRFIVADL